MNYSMEEINLMCIYDCTSRSALIDNLEEAAEYVYDPDMLKLIDQTIEKLQHTTDNWGCSERGKCVFPS